MPSQPDSHSDKVNKMGMRNIANRKRLHFISPTEFHSYPDYFTALSERLSLERDQLEEWETDPSHYWLLEREEGVTFHLLELYEYPYIRASELQDLGITGLVRLLRPQFQRQKLKNVGAIILRPEFSFQQVYQENVFLLILITAEFFRGDGESSIECGIAVIVDLPERQFAAQIKELEEVLYDRFRVSWMGHIGSCSQCRKEIDLLKQTELFITKQTSEVWMRCSHCRRKPILYPDTYLEISDRLRQAIYQIYKGQCQYCLDGETISYKECQVDHILPKRASINEVIDAWREEGLSDLGLEHLKKELLPPHMNSVLNYTLACQRHNSIKSGKILPPAISALLLLRARQKASEILRNVQSSTVIALRT